MQDGEFISLKPALAAGYVQAQTDEKEKARLRKVYLWANQTRLEGVEPSNEPIPTTTDVWLPGGPTLGSVALGLAVVGAILAVYAFFFFDVSGGASYGREIANLERIASRTMIMIAGVGAVVAGSVLYVGDKIFVELTRPR